MFIGLSPGPYIGSFDNKDNSLRCKPHEKKITNKSFGNRIQQSE